MQDTYRQKIAEHFYALGLEQAIKEAAPSFSQVKDLLGTAIGEYSAGSGAVAELKDKSKRGGRKKTLVNKVNDLGQGYVKSKVQGIVDPRLPKKESLPAKALNIAGDVLSLAPNIGTPAAAARLAQRVARMDKNNTRMLDKMQRSSSKIERAAADAYRRADPRMGIN